MQLKNCDRCGALFLKRESEYCDRCKKEFLESYKRVRDYVRSHPKSTIWDVHKDLNMPLTEVQQVLRFVEQKEKR